ncbi:MAG: sulfurtransferase [Polaribacter sp.]
MPLKINKPLVSVDWLYNHLEDEKLIILDCTIPKVTAESIVNEDKTQIKGAVFFDIKNVFSDKNALFPNTVLSPKEFEEKAQGLGIHKDSKVVCYDDLGIYSSPRVWWMFYLMGFKNIAVLNGGLPAWKAKNYPIEKPKTHQPKKGNFKVDYLPEKIKFTDDILQSLVNKNILIADARSKGRFLGTEPEPRKEVKSGHIPNSVSFPFSETQENGFMKTKEDLVSLFNKLSSTEKEFIFSCGTGITASILALSAEIAGIKNYAIYDGSWTEWALTDGLPIEK